MSRKRLQFVVGKGGVGKSTVTAALAVAALGPGRRVLALELGEARGLSRLFDAADRVGAEPIEVSPGLFVAAVEGEDALAEYLSLIMPIRRLVKSIFKSRLYRTFVAAAPGLKELMTIGKIWFEDQKLCADGSPQWDAIVVDAGASGHSLQYLQMPQAAAATFKSGLVHRESDRVASMLRDGSVTEVHVVARPEDMPLVEATEIIERLRGDLALPLGRLFVNRCRKPAPRDIGESLARLGVQADPTHTLFFQTMQRAVSWLGIQENGIGMVEERLGIATVRLPNLVAVEFGMPEIRRLAAEVSAAEEAV